VDGIVKARDAGRGPAPLRVGRAKSAKPCLRHPTFNGAKMACFLSGLHRLNPDTGYSESQVIGCFSSFETIPKGRDLSATMLPYPAMPVPSKTRPLSSKRTASINTAFPKASSQAVSPSAMLMLFKNGHHANPQASENSLLLVEIINHLAPLLA